MKLLALDIDDTTLCRDGTLSQKNADAIHRVCQSGGHAVIITGRSPLGARHVWEKLPCDDVCVCFGGAVIVNMRTGKVLDEICMDKYVLQKALNHAHALGLVSHIYRDDTVMTEYANEYSDKYVSYLKLPPYEVVPDIRNMLHEKITKMLCFTETERLWENIESFRSVLGDSAGISSSSKHLIEINDPSADKGAGLLHLCRLLGVDKRESVAVGDTTLDIPMIKAAGVGIAVKNAQPDVLKAADIIAPDCDEDAIAWVAERYF